MAGGPKEQDTRANGPASASEHPLAARERILRTAYELFRSYGVNAIGVDRIVAEAGVAKTTLYRHFHSKDGLVLAVFERHEHVWTWDWLEQEVERRAATGGAGVLAIFDAFHDWFAQDSYQGCLFTNVLLETHDRSSSVRMTSVARLAIIRELVQRFAEQEGVRDPDRFAHQMQILMWGSIVAALDGYAEAAEQARAMAHLLLEQERGGSQENLD
jgi:AcrR family transcriptional regulator